MNIETDPSERDFFKSILGLNDGQERVGFVPSTKRSNWYNELGEWVGWGDLTREDMQTIARLLEDGERFIVLHEWDSYRRFLRDIVPDPSRILRTENNIELAYIAEHAVFVIERGSIFRVEDVQPIGQPEEHEGVTFRFVRSSEAKAMILGKQGVTLN